MNTPVIHSYIHLSISQRNKLLAIRKFFKPGHAKRVDDGDGMESEGIVLVEY